MTTALYDRRTRTLGADTQNTTSDGSTIVRVSKIEKLKNGWYFLGSGHLYTIDESRMWAEKKWSPDHMPTFELFLGDTEEYGFACLAIDPKTNDVWYIDNELTPIKVMDDVIGVGSGSSWAVAQVEAGKPMIEALRYAASKDSGTSGPFEVIQI